MKTRTITIALSLILFVFTSCEKNETLSTNSLEGSYIGTLNFEPNLKNSSTGSQNVFEATAEIKELGDGIIEMHCLGGDLDTTLMLNYYNHNDSIMVCLLGTDFEHMYGHGLGSGHMSGGMMGDMQNGETEWQHHMSDEHIETDDHFGGFDMQNHAFEYRFNMHDGTFHFKGIKE